MRKPMIAGNWKMNKTPAETIDFVKELNTKKLSTDVEKVIAVPFTSLYPAGKLIEESDIKLAAQNMYFENEGAFTGEISPIMLKDLNTSYVILGHSERREIFKESDELLNKKIKAAISNNISPILCCGETLEERESFKHMDKVKKQIIAALSDIDEIEINNLVVAYEPIWAIGTGKTASSKDAEEMCKFIREVLSDLYSTNFAEKIRILYGGSVKPENVKDIMKQENIDGALVGGASLKVDSFESLINY